MKEGLFSKKNRKLISDPLGDQNPITIQVLGICSALAITVQLQQALVMAISVVFVMIFSSLTISALRDLIPSRIRIIFQLVVVSFLVVLVDEVLKAILPDVQEKLTVFIGLIVTNCIIMGRLEAFALGNKLRVVMQVPDINPPPPIGAITASSSSISSISSNAAVPCPAITFGLLKG